MPNTNSTHYRRWIVWTGAIRRAGGKGLLVDPATEESNALWRRYMRVNRRAFQQLLGGRLKFNWTTQRLLPIVPPVYPNTVSPPSSNLEVHAWFATEVQPYEPSLRAYLRQAFPSQADVDDLVQETYLRVLRARENRPINSGKAFLFAVARNAVRDLIRRRAVANTVGVTEIEALPVLDSEPGIIDLVSRREELSLLREAIRALPERCREVFLLRKIQSLSQKEIALRLNITENTVETLVAKGVRRCADYLRRRASEHRSP